MSKTTRKYKLNVLKVDFLGSDIMNYSQKITEYLEKEKREYEELVSRASMPYANEVDEFLAQNALNERVSWRSDLLKKITDKLPEDIAVQALCPSEHAADETLRRQCRRR
jgi:hypothetical protein